MMLCFVGSITFDALSILDSAGEGHMTPFLAIFALRYARVHIHIPYYCYKTTYIEVPVNQFFCFVTTLDVLNIDPNDGHVRLGETFII